MLMIEQLAHNWNAMTEADRALYWEDFTEMLDAGEAGYHRYYRLLMPVWSGAETAATAGLKLPPEIAGQGYKPFHFPPEATA